MKPLMNYILRIAIPSAVHQLFDYLLPSHIPFKDLQPGIRIKIPFGSRKIIAWLIEITDTSDIAKEKLKPIIAILDQTPLLTKPLLKLCQWASEYYHAPLGIVLMNATPSLLRKKEKIQIKEMAYWCLTDSGKNVDLNLLKNAPKQKQLLNLLETEAISQPDIIHANIPYTTIQSAHQKGWIITTEGPSPLKKQQFHTVLKLTPPQEIAIKTIMNHLHHYQSFLLYGVTGSGKTEVYLTMIEKILAQGKQALVLIPEINLTPQMLERFQARFQNSIFCFHSKLNDQERLNAWLLAKQGKAKIVIGTRSAIFIPFENLGIIVLDEEHDLSFKQQENFRYSARDLAIVRARMENIPIILGSATPSLESLYNVENKNFQLLNLPDRTGQSVHPHYNLIDIRGQILEGDISRPLLDKIKLHLNNNNQVLIFLNRRGYAPILLCHDCGWIASCSRCEANFIYHWHLNQLRCPRCDTIKPLHTLCPKCHSKNLQPLGTGTEKLEIILKQHFPNAPIIRIDRDTTRRKNAMKNLYQTIQNGQHQILIGTQMIAKGHHLPNVTLVAIINADNGFFSADFRAIERTGQLLIQVSGRAGRAEKPGEILIQTHQPNNPLLLQLTQHGYDDFARKILKERQEAQLPPYVYFALLRSQSLTAHKANDFLNQIKKFVSSNLPIPNVVVLGPIPSPISKRKGHYQFQLLFQATQRKILHEVLSAIIQHIDESKLSKQVKWSLDIDPQEMY